MSNAKRLVWRAGKGWVLRGVRVVFKPVVAPPVAVAPVFKPVVAPPPAAPAVAPAEKATLNILPPEDSRPAAQNWDSDSFRQERSEPRGDLRPRRHQEAIGVPFLLEHLGPALAVGVSSGVEYQAAIGVQK